jgi:hypothetical protein
VKRFVYAPLALVPLLLLTACSSRGRVEGDAGVDASLESVTTDAGLDASAEVDAGSAATPWTPPEPPSDTLATTMEAQRAELFAQLRAWQGLSDAQMTEVERIFAGSPYLGQGNPLPTRHPMKRSACRAIREQAGLTVVANPKCGGARNMVPLWDPTRGQTERDATVCIDQFEFPDIPCEYPVTYARANEAAEICAAVGKRICDAHEWEGACAGAVLDPADDYAFGKPRPYATWLHNKARKIGWAYGPKKDHAKCATGSAKSEKCFDGGWMRCGTNTYPAGAFPECKSSFDVYDQHGNAAEHMNLPLKPEEMASRGGTGQTEMKGSWFIFLRADAHEDDCRWRAKDWHPSTLMAEDSHRNYHLGFRCCKDAEVGGLP